MKKRNRILVAALVVMVIGGVVWLTVRTHEPVYQGKSLTKWVLQYSINTYAPQEPDVTAKRLREESESAIRQIGSKGVPTLVKMASAHDTPLKIRVRSWIRELDASTGLTWGEGPFPTQILAIAGFEVLGPLGKDAVPALISLLKSQDAPTRVVAIESLGRIGPPAKDAVPALLECLNDTNVFVRSVAGGDLKRIDPIAACKAGVK